MSTTAATTITSLDGSCSPRRSTMPESPLPAHSWPAWRLASRPTT